MLGANREHSTIRQMVPHWVQSPLANPKQATGNGILLAAVTLASATGIWTCAADTYDRTLTHMEYRYAETIERLALKLDSMCGEGFTDWYLLGPAGEGEERRSWSCLPSSDGEV